ncbi:hypothetical protein F5882DRAFT_290886, partial [Hyaloscypha sp. PMI_1271]
YPNDTIEVITSITTIKEVHVTTIINLLETYSIAPIPPYNYSFLVNSTKEFFEITNIITSIGISVIISLT